MVKEYTVEAGDTLYGIAKQFGTCVAEIKKLNNLVNDSITVGQVLKIKEDTDPLTYTVQKGDSLYSISKKFNIPVLELMKLNNITSTVLDIGQVLVLVDDMEQESNGIIFMPIYEDYEVQKGDNIYSIAQKFNTTVDQIRQDNNLTSDSLSIGQILKIKVGEDVFGIEECYGTGYDDLENNYITYTVQKGDSLYSIAEKFNTNVEQLKKLNNLTNTELSLGQVLKIKEVS